MKKLLIVDLQKQFRSYKYDNIVSKIKSLSEQYDKVYATVFSQGENDNYRQKLNWCGCQDCSEEDLEFDTSSMEVIKKDGYGITNISSYFSEEDEVDIIGCDSDACIMAICFQLWDLGIDFKVLTGYIYTSAREISDDDVIKIMKRNFGSCIDNK